ncbi:MAG: SRPBCC family protein [Flavobacteriales bacterium]|nr:SRPBCC family protein [Flavobacteriales bacterium]
MKHVLEREQFLPITLTEAWAFFSSPRNLGSITPPDMGFRIRGPYDDKPMHTGQCIRYTVKPMFGIPLTWVTRLDEVDAPHSFVDTQMKGPYKPWWHQHAFEVVEGGVLMRDRVEYELPLGAMGELAHRIFVRRRLKEIFDFRNDTLRKRFPLQEERMTNAPGPIVP